MTTTLFVTVDAAFPPVSGADLRNWGNALASSAFGPVVLASIGEPAVAAPSSAIEIVHLPDMMTSEIWSSDFNPDFSEAFIAGFETLCRRVQPDVVVLESLALAKLVTFAKPLTARVIIDFHNVESDLSRQQSKARRHPWTSSGQMARIDRLRAIEARTMALADAVWVCSGEDRARLWDNGWTLCPISIVPNGVPRPQDICRALAPRVRRIAPTLLFLGHLSYPPNVEAALWLIDVSPVIRRHLPGARFIIAGRNPSPAFFKTPMDGAITVVANPDTTDGLLSTADFAVMPIRWGGGTRIKALEAMAWGAPMIATARAIEGLELEDGVHVRLAESKRQFVRAINDLWTRPDVYDAQRTAAHRHVWDRFGPEAIQSAVGRALHHPNAV